MCYMLIHTENTFQAKNYRQLFSSCVDTLENLSKILQGKILMQNIAALLDMSVTTTVQLDLNLMLASTVPAFKIARIACE